MNAETEDLPRRAAAILAAHFRATSETMRHCLPTSEPLRADEAAPRNLPPLSEQREAGAAAAVGPTDPEVYNRRPTPHPIPLQLYEIA